MRKIGFLPFITSRSVSPVAATNGLLNNFITGWEFDESSGTNCSEISGYATYDATATATNPSIVAGLGGNARRFSNSSSENITAPSTIWSDIGSSVTALSYSCWVKFTTVQQSIIMRADGESGACGLLISINTSGQIETFQNVTGNYTFPGGYMVVGGATVLSAGSWVHIAVTYDGTYTRVYLNGSEDGSRNILADSGQSQIYLAGFGSQYYHCYFGHNEQSNNAKLDGDLDSFYIWNSCLTPTQVTQLYNSGAGLFYSSFTL